MHPRRRLWETASNLHCTMVMCTCPRPVRGRASMREPMYPRAPQQAPPPERTNSQGLKGCGVGVTTVVSVGPAARTPTPPHAPNPLTCDAGERASHGRQTFGGHVWDQPAMMARLASLKRLALCTKVERRAIFLVRDFEMLPCRSAERTPTGLERAWRRLLRCAPRQTSSHCQMLSSIVLRTLDTVPRVQHPTVEVLRRTRG